MVCVCVSSVVVPCRGPAVQARPAGIVSTAPDLQPKPPASSSTSDDANKEEEEDGEGGEGSEEESESDDDDVQITIGAIQTEPVLPPYNRSQSYTRMTIPPGGASAQLKKVDLDAVPTLAGQSLYDVDLDATDRPWRMPGADITDYFNYGFTEDTWKLYCDKQRKMKGEVAIHNKIVVSLSRDSHRNLVWPPKRYWYIRRSVRYCIYSMYCVSVCLILMHSGVDILLTLLRIIMIKNTSNHSLWQSSRH